MNLNDIPDGAARTQPPLPTREQLDMLAMQFARRERELAELAEHIDRQLTSLAELRALLLAVLWPRTQRPT